MASSTPRPRSFSSTSSELSASAITVVSVISRQSWRRVDARLAAGSPSPGTSRSRWPSWRADRFTRTRSRLVGDARPARPPAGGRPRAAPTRPMSRMSPVSSARSMNSAAASSPASGCCQRTSASAPDDRARRRLDLGLVVDDELVVLDGLAQLDLVLQPAAHLRAGATRRTPRCGRDRAPWPRTSPRRRGAAGRRRSRRRRSVKAMPTLAVVAISWPCDERPAGGSPCAAPGRWPRPRPTPARPSTSTTSSSPPMRASTAPGGQASSSRLASVTSRSSPSPCPSESLITLKRSRSNSSTARPDRRVGWR